MTISRRGLFGVAFGAAVVAGAPKQITSASSIIDDENLAALFNLLNSHPEASATQILALAGVHLKNGYRCADPYILSGDEAEIIFAVPQRWKRDV